MMCPHIHRSPFPHGAAHSNVLSEHICMITMKRQHCKKSPVDFTVKYWQVVASAFTVNFTGACRLYTGTITHGREGRAR